MAQTIEIVVPSAEIRRVQASIVAAGTAGVKAQRKAIREVGRAARTEATRSMSGELGVPQKLIRRRIQVHARRAKKAAVANGRLWGGLKRGLGAGEHKTVAQKLKTAHPKGFLASKRRSKRGRVGWFTRVGRERLPIQEHFLDLDPARLGPALRRGVEKGFSKYPRRLRQLYQLELARERKRRGRSRRRQRSR